MARLQVSDTENRYLRTTQSFPVARRETFDVHQILLKLNLPFAVLLIFDKDFNLPLHLVFLLTSRHDNGFGGLFWGVCFRTLLYRNFDKVSGDLDLSKAGWTCKKTPRKV